MTFDGQAGFNGRLRKRVVRAPAPNPIHWLKIPGLGRLAFTRDAGEAGFFGREYFSTHLRATHRNSSGEIVGVHDLGSGMVTNVGVLYMAYDWLHSASSSNGTTFDAALNLSAIVLSRWHASGKGVAAAAATDFLLGTASTVGGQTPVAGTSSTIPSGTAPKYQTVATINYTGTEAVTEWGLFMTSTQSSTTGTPLTGSSATSATVTGTPLTASSTTVQGLQGQIIVPGTTAVWGLATSNSTSVIQVPAWYVQSTGAAGSTPGTTEAFTLRPVMWDRRQFAAINVNNGDSIQFTYQLQINSGG